MGNLLCPRRPPRELGLYSGPDPLLLQPQGKAKAKAKATAAPVTSLAANSVEDLSGETGSSALVEEPGTDLRRRKARRLSRDSSVGLVGDTGSVPTPESLVEEASSSSSSSSSVPISQETAPSLEGARESEI